MNIQTKFNIGDLVYYKDCDEDLPLKCKVMSISVVVTEYNNKIITNIYYELCHILDNVEEKWLLSRYHEDELKPV